MLFIVTIFSFVLCFWLPIQTKQWLGDATCDSVVDILHQLNRSFVTTASVFSSRDIISQPSKLLITFIRSERLSAASRKTLLDAGVIFYHAVAQLYDKNDIDGLTNLLRFEYKSYLGIAFSLYLFSQYHYFSTFNPFLLYIQEQGLSVSHLQSMIHSHNRRFHLQWKFFPEALISRRRWRLWAKWTPCTSWSSKQVSLLWLHD